MYLPYVLEIQSHLGEQPSALARKRLAVKRPAVRHVTTDAEWSNIFFRLKCAVFCVRARASKFCPLLRGVFFLSLSLGFLSFFFRRSPMSLGKIYKSSARTPANVRTIRQRADWWERMVEENSRRRKRRRPEKRGQAREEGGRNTRPNPCQVNAAASSHMQ